MNGFPVEQSESGKSRAESFSSDSSRATSKSALSTGLNSDNISLFSLLDPSTVTQVKKRKDETYKWVQDVVNGRRNINFNANIQIDKMKKKFDRAFVRIDRIQSASSTEKLFYAFSVYTIFLFGFLIGNKPQWVHILYSILIAILLPIRFITYIKSGWGYYLADLCYYVNFLLITYIWIFPESKILFVCCCSFSWGTLSFAVITWRNKLVLHSIDKITSTLIHVLPGVVMYVMIHQLSPEFKKQRFPGSHKVEQWHILSGIFYTSVSYFIWQMLYHYFITIRKSEKIKNGQVTSFEYLRKSYANVPIGKFINSLPEPFPVLAFNCVQYLYQISTMSLCPILYKSKICCELFVSLVFMAAAYNGATYYVDHYGKKFQKEVIRLQKEIEALQEVQNDEAVSEPMAKETLDAVK
ncbi:glycerophosphocholine acyltransferase [Martiniozyma asiatica (nom. inval.)]|nr:glycerophosphocholine acyltransferase [Martiniozyma asiatica]